MLLGIDVGGTFTDAVVIKDEEILAQAKVPTNHEDVLQSILAALDKVLLAGYRTADLANGSTMYLSTVEMTDKIIENL